MMGIFSPARAHDFVVQLLMPCRASFSVELGLSGFVVTVQPAGLYLFPFLVGEQTVLRDQLRDGSKKPLPAAFLFMKPDLSDLRSFMRFGIS
jgi:hypothetical protein